MERSGAHNDPDVTQNPADKVLPSSLVLHILPSGSYSRYAKPRKSKMSRSDLNSPGMGVPDPIETGTTSCRDQKHEMANLVSAIATPKFSVTKSNKNGDGRVNIKPSAEPAKASTVSSTLLSVLTLVRATHMRIKSSICGQF